jgi:hypothetical protein
MEAEIIVGDRIPEDDITMLTQYLLEIVDRDGSFPLSPLFSSFPPFLVSFNEIM